MIAAAIVGAVTGDDTMLVQSAAKDVGTSAGVDDDDVVVVIVVVTVGRIETCGGGAKANEDSLSLVGLLPPSGTGSDINDAGIEKNGMDEVPASLVIPLSLLLLLLLLLLLVLVLVVVVVVVVAAANIPPAVVGRGTNSNTVGNVDDPPTFAPAPTIPAPPDPRRAGRRMVRDDGDQLIVVGDIVDEDVDIANVGGDIRLASLPPCSVKCCCC